LNIFLKALLILSIIIFSNVLAAKDQEKPIDLSAIGGDFTLHSARGDVSLEDYRGKVVLLYFGYINCPDACPTTLSQWRKAFNKLNDSEKNRAQGIMVSVDPERDTLQELDAFTGFFHENIVGVTGSIKELKSVTKQYGADFQAKPHKPGKNYGVDHSFFVFVINAKGKVVDRVDFTLKADKLVEIIRQAM